MVGLGDLLGGTFESSARGVSADGSVIVGFGQSASGREAFVWTSGGGMVGLGELPGGDFESGATDVSADGSVVVGLGTSASGREAFIWDDANGMRNLRDVLVNDLFLDLTGWTLTFASGVSAPIDKSDPAMQELKRLRTTLDGIRSDVVVALDEIENL